MIGITHTLMVQSCETGGNDSSFMRECTHKSSPMALRHCTMSLVKIYLLIIYFMIGTTRNLMVQPCEQVAILVAS